MRHQHVIEAFRAPGSESIALMTKIRSAPAGQRETIFPA
jgi:hypothetical protein